MLSLWSNCKLGVKLQASFALVMLVFVAAIIGIFVTNAKIKALATLQSTMLIPARAVANQVASVASSKPDTHGHFKTGHFQSWSTLLEGRKGGSYDADLAAPARAARPDSCRR